MSAPHSGTPLKQYLHSVSSNTGYPIPLDRLSPDHLMLEHIAKTIDHSLLDSALTDKELTAGCEIAKARNVASVCILPTGIEIAVDVLGDSEVAVGTIVGFPFGYEPTKIKVAATHLYCGLGAREIDTVAHTGKVKGREWDYILRDIGAIRDAAREYGAIVKLIFENDLLENEEQKVGLCVVCNKLDLDFAKTSSGYAKPQVGMVHGKKVYGYEGATLPDLDLMREQCKPNIEIKAAGGVGTFQDALEVIARGCTRIGATRTEAILDAAARAGYK